MSNPLTSPIRVAVLTVSDRCSRGETTDTAGPAVCALCRDQLNAQIVETACLSDEAQAIEQTLRNWAGRSDDDGRAAIDLVLTVGGTGLAPRDVTPEATASVLERRHPGLLELARLRCFEITPRTFLSRGEAGTLGRTLIINLPGSVRGSTENLQAIADILPHAIDTLRGDVQDDGRPQAAATTGKVVKHDD